VEYIIPMEARKKGMYHFVIESSCNGMFGVPASGTIDPPDMNRYYSVRLNAMPNVRGALILFSQLASADLVVPNQEAWHLMWDFNTLKQLVEALPGNTVLQNKALVTANAIMNVFDHEDKASIAKARKLAEQVFGEGWAKKGVDVYKEGNVNEQIYGIGHCHIDTAW
jgi:alpha-mannosidase